jgi:hypothetical protein
MTALAKSAAPRHPTRLATGPVAPAVHPQTTYAIQLIDRRTGAIHRINGAPLVVYSSDPDVASFDLMQDRDPTIWSIRAEALGTPSAEQF